METTQNFRHQKLWFIAQNLESESQIFYTIGNPRFHYKCRVRELHGRRIEGCFHGWVILSDHSDNALWSLWNPLTSRFIRLPPLITNKKDSYECCLSSPPEDQGSHFLLLSDTIPIIFFCQLGPKRKRLKWTKRSYAKQLRSISREDGCLLQSPACCNGKVYAIVLRSYTFVVQVDIVVRGEEVVIGILPIVSIPDSGPLSRCPSLNNIKSWYAFLKGDCMELFFIQVFFDDKMGKRVAEVNLFKLDMTTMKWKEIVDLEDAVFFVALASGYFTCYNCAVDSKLGGYIHVLGECGKIIYSSHVKDRTVSLSSLSRPVRESQASAWAMLEWRLEADHAEEEEDRDTKVVVRQVKGESGNTTSESHLLNMPLDILQLIMKFCIGVEYMKFRATCKYCCLAAPSIPWRSETRLRGYSLISPWLMVLDNYRDTITFIDPLFGDRYFIRTPQELTGGYEIHCSKYGWLLMYKNKAEPRQLVLFNPFTCNILELPEIEYMGSFCFSSPPTSPDCMVVGFSRLEPRHIFVHFVHGKSRWHTYNLSYNISSHQFRINPYFFHFAMFSGGYIYTLYHNERVEAFRVLTGNCYSWKLVADKAPSRSGAQYFLSKCDQHILLVIVGEVGGSVEVFKVNESTQEWEKIDDLGKHMIYIANTSCFCLEAKSPEMGNKIYFPRLLHDDDKKIVFYSLETCTYHTFDDKRIQEGLGADLFGTKHYCHPHAWIEPSWS